MTSLSDGFLLAAAAISLLVSLLSGDVSADTEFEFGPSGLSLLKPLGQAHVSAGSVSLTLDLPVPYSGAGRVLYSEPVELRRPASFSTFFTFSVGNLNPSSVGGGMAFVISPDGDYVGDSGGFMGVIGGGAAQNGVVAVEFDTRMDDEFDDINGNHVGLDLNSMVSSPAADLGTIGVNLSGGGPVNSWIDYSGPTRSIRVYVSRSDSKPPDPIISSTVDLSEILVNGSAFVGFSGSTQGSTETHTIQFWRFKSFFPPPTDTNTNTTSSPKKVSGGTIAGVVTASAFFLSFFALAFIWAYNKKHKNASNWEKTFLPSEAIKTPKEFTYKDLKSATKGFHPDRVIGHGAFGTVYKGQLRSTGDLAAIKRCSHSGQGKAEFLSELSIIGTLRHRNLVRLQGWCHEKGEILLVYDLMSNGSLDKALFESRMSLSWAHRVKILLGVASALSYLHEECENRVVHRDVKSSNVMLDQWFNSRLGDFGLAKQIEHNYESTPGPTAAAGTMGYLAPEYVLTGRASEKSDVFSYGAVVLEVVTGRRVIEKGNFGNLVDWVWGLHREGKLMEAVDLRLGGEFDEGEVGRVVMVGLGCSNPDPAGRPSARGVVQMLMGDLEVPSVPRMKPAASFSFSTSQLMMTLEEESVSDDSNEEVITISTSSSENGFSGGDDGMELV